MPTIPEDFIRDNDIRKDWVDLRDQPYVPGLAVLRTTTRLNPVLMREAGQAGRSVPVFGIRNQGQSGRCVGFALAALIDIQRLLQRPRAAAADGRDDRDFAALGRDIVSADMLYRMAFFHDRYPDIAELDAGFEGVRTLRSAIKGFYHHGACLDWPEGAAPADADRWQSSAFWPESADRDRLFPTVEQAKRAREIGLGAYFRLASVLNHYHAALNDAEAVLATANIHDGWLNATPDNGGIITWPPGLGRTGTHAFVLTGYDEKGFHVLNSWGEAWGGYQGQAGIGLWSYADWARNIVDGWVLRLGVSTPAAFDAAIGEKGTKGLVGGVQSGSTPCLELVGHYMHLDDGFHVSSGSYPSFKDGWARTCDHLGRLLDPGAKPQPDQSKYRGILVWLPGSLEGIKPAFTAATQRKDRIKSLGLYPYTIFWCNSFVEKSLEVLEFIFDSCEAQAGAGAGHLDDLIEQRVQGVGRAFWRDIEMSARRALRGSGELPYERDEQDDPERVEKGHVGTFLADILQLREETGCEVHLVAEGAGALVLHEMLSILAEDAENAPEDRLFPSHDAGTLFDTVHLVMPAIGMPRARKQIMPLIRRMNGYAKGHEAPEPGPGAPAVFPFRTSAGTPRARVYVPTPELDTCIHFGSYGKSILHLVARAFEDRYPPPTSSDDGEYRLYSKPRQFLGMAEIATDESFEAPSAIYRLNRVAAQKHAFQPVSQSEVNRDRTIADSIWEAITEFQKTTFHCRGGARDDKDHR